MTPWVARLPMTFGKRKIHDFSRKLSVAALIDHEAYRSAAQAVASLDDVSLTDEEIDLFLPKSLHKTGASAA